MDELDPGGLEAILLLCDAAQVSNGKLFILGGGVALIGPRPQGLAVALRILVPWDRANVGHEWRVDLVDEDGAPVEIQEKSVVIKGQFEAGRPAGLRPGTPLPVALAINISPLPLPPGRSYEYRLSIDGETQPTWRVPFTVRAPKPAQTK